MTFLFMNREKKTLQRNNEIKTKLINKLVIKLRRVTSPVIKQENSSDNPHLHN